MGVEAIMSSRLALRRLSSRKCTFYELHKNIGMKY